MLEPSRYAYGVMALALASALLLAGCQQHPAAEHSPLPEPPALEPAAPDSELSQSRVARSTESDGVSFRDRVAAGNICYSMSFFGEEDTRLDASDYTLDSWAVPSFTINADVFEDELFVIGGIMWNAAEDCSRYLLVTIQTDHAEAIEILPVENWRAAAGPRAINALNRLEQECAALSPQEALLRFGVPGVERSYGDTTAPQGRFEGCRAAILSNAYALRIRHPDGEVFLFNVLGEVSTEE